MSRINLFLFVTLLCSGLADLTLLEQIRMRSFMRVHVLDVGQGDGTLLKYQGKNILIDGGDRPHKGQPDFVEALRERGVDRIDLMVLSHAHADHLYGLVQCLKAMPVTTILEPGIPHDTELFASFLKLARQKQVVIKHPEEGMTVHIGPLFEIDVLPPLDGFSEKDLNNHSIVLNVHFAKNRFLFTGDIEAPAEKALVAKMPERLKADVLKIPHHGSKTSSTLPFLKAVSPTLAVLSLSGRNTYGFPHEEALKRIEKQTEKVYRTDLDGNIKFVFNRERSVSIPHYRRKWWRFWEAE